MFAQRKNVFHENIGFNKIHKSSQGQYLHKTLWRWQNHGLNNIMVYVWYLLLRCCFQTVAKAHIKAFGTCGMLGRQLLVIVLFVYGLEYSILIC
jgi:hypothetical protein